MALAHFWPKASYYHGLLAASELYLTMLVSNCVFASRAVSKGLKILRFFILPSSSQVRTEGVLLGGKSQKITEWDIALLLCYTISETWQNLKGFWRQNTNCSTKTQPQTHRCLSMLSGINFTVTQFTVTEIILQLPKKFYSYRKNFTVTGRGMH